MNVVRRLKLLAPLAALSLAACGLNSVPTAEENVNAKWGNLQADYQRRADLICSEMQQTVTGATGERLLQLARTLGVQRGHRLVRRLERQDAVRAENGGQCHGGH